MAEIIVNSGDYTLNGGSYLIHNAGAWYNNQILYYKEINL